MKNHSGKKLSEVSFEDIFEGMEVISTIDGEGKIVTLLPDTDDKSTGRVKIDYTNGATELAQPFRFTHVRVKS